MKTILTEKYNKILQLHHFSQDSLAKRVKQSTTVPFNFQDFMKKCSIE